MPLVDIRPHKMALRAQFRTYRDGISGKTKRRLDTAILGRVLALPAYRRARVILTYVSTPIEVDTHALVHAALSDGKKVAVPRCVPGTREMEFYQIRSLDELIPGTFGVWEPDPNVSRCLQNDTYGLCVVPGLGFDLAGYRLGYGKGYYDRFLARFHGITLGICYYACVKNHLPHGHFDRPVHLLITERSLHHIHAPKPPLREAGVRKHIRSGDRTGVRG